MPKVFISYRRSDSSDVASRLHDRLTMHFGAGNIFKDVDSIPLGIDFIQNIEASISKCDVVLVIIGKDWLNATDNYGNRRIDQSSDIVRREIEIALNNNTKLIPVLVHNEVMPNEESLPESLRLICRLNAAQIRSGRDFENDIIGLYRAISPPRRFRKRIIGLVSIIILLSILLYFLVVKSVLTSPILEEQLNKGESTSPNIERQIGEGERIALFVDLGYFSWIYYYSLAADMPELDKNIIILEQEATKISKLLGISLPDCEEALNIEEALEAMRTIRLQLTNEKEVPCFAIGMYIGLAQGAGIKQIIHKGTDYEADGKKQIVIIERELRLQLHYLGILEEIEKFYPISATLMVNDGETHEDYNRKMENLIQTIKQLLIY